MTRRKRTPRKTTRKASRKKDTTNKKLISILITIIIALIAAIIFLIYTINTHRTKSLQTTQIPQAVEKVTKKVQETKDKFDKYFEKVEEIKKDKFEEYTKDFYKDYSDTAVPAKKKVEKAEEQKKPGDIETLKEEPKVFPANTTEPKLAIIFDDVTTNYQLKKIKDIGFITTVSIMPPTKIHPNSAKIARDLPFYMIHFPMQAKYFKNEESSTLHVNDSYEKIEKRVAQIRSLYPRAKYTNNHTGSEFTSNKEAMDKLFRALVKYGFIFVDSRTTSHSVAKEMAKKYNMPYIARNVFLDNEQNYNYIRGQLKKAVAIAKKNGFAIAICHPHPATISTLKKSKDLIKGLEMIQLNQLPINE